MQTLYHRDMTLAVKPPQPNRPHIVIVSPVLSDANNGNWQTANRWRQMLSAHFHCRIVKTWPDKFANQDDVMIALHARRSADSVQAWTQSRARQQLPQNLIVALTGTDLYRDIQTDAAAQASLDMASSLIVLQELAPRGLRAQWQAKTQVIFQSTPSTPTLTKSDAHLRVVMVGHLRDEKSPETLFEAARILNQPDQNIYIDHIGAPLDAALGTAAKATAAACPHYRWLDAMPHAQTLRTIGRAHVLVHTSKMEGGAHVVMEAVCAGTPVLASRIDGNVGMLGADYAGYFELGDAAGLAKLMMECRRTQNDANGLLSQLKNQCALRAPLFAPAAEQAALVTLVQSVLIR
jgi:putative glycosyltransferase (TIGR04348 family)